MSYNVYKFYCKNCYMCLTVIMLQLQEKLRCAVCLKEKWLTAKKQKRR